MKLFAFFLPQFHTIPENDAWWGKGFTEWTNVKAAKPLYPGHTIIHPYNDNYYELLSKETVEWQTSLLKDYDVDGLIYYHYYFKGKLLLEKPAENLLEWKDIDQPFFFCWANHPWIRSWEGKSEVLVPLSYGNEQDWEEHFKYLLRFFKDDRYEKKDNKPVFMIFEPAFKEKNAMFSYFNRRCVEEGFDGICLIETKYKYTSETELHKPWENTSYIYYRQPNIQMEKHWLKRLSVFARGLNKIKRMTKYNNIKVYEGQELMESLIEDHPKGKNIINGVWFEWDNTYRHKDRGYIIKAYSKELFDKYMDSLSDDEYVFINAWNEWCEGMVTEPTEEYGYKYLEWIKEWKKRK